MSTDSGSTLPPPPRPPSPPPSDEQSWFRGWRRWAIVSLGAIVALGAFSEAFGSGDEQQEVEDTSSADDEPTEADGGAETETGEPPDTEDIDSTATTTTTSTTTSTTTVPEPVGGTRETPWAYGLPTTVELETFGDADGSVWSISVGQPSDITAAVLAENRFNDPPPEGLVFAGFDVSTQLLTANKVPLSAGFNLTWELHGGSTSAVYDGTTVDGLFGCGVAPSEYNSFAEVFTGGTIDGVVCIPIPVEDLQDPRTQVAINLTGGDRVIFGADGVPAPTPQPPALDETIGTGEGAGTRQSPFRLDTATELVFETFGDADGSLWTVTVGGPTDITAAVLAENQFNEPPPQGVVFVGFDVEMTLVSAPIEPLSAGFNLSWELLGGASNGVYGNSTISNVFGCGVAPNEFDAFSEVFAGGTLTGTICIPLPAEDLGAPGTQVAINFVDGERAVFG